MSEESPTPEIQNALQDALAEGRAHLTELRQSIPLSQLTSGSSYNIPVKGPPLIPARNVGGSGSPAIQGFTIADTSTYDSSGNLTHAKIRVVSSIAAGKRPDGFNNGDDPPFVLAVPNSGILWAHITINTGKSSSSSSDSAATGDTGAIGDTGSGSSLEQDGGLGDSGGLTGNGGIQGVTGL